MKLYKKLLLMGTAMAFIAGGGTLKAETVKTTTVVTQKEVPNVQKTNFSAFDLNHDGILSMNEVGEKLFYIFDTDGNEVIDNIEFNNKKVMTVIPMQKQTFTFVDFDNDGQPDKSNYTYDTFLEKSQLARFDKKMDGLSPADFIGKSFLDLDINHSHAIELKEWKKAYTVMVHPEAAEQDHYN